MDTPMMVKSLESAQEISTPQSIPKSSSEIMTSASASTTSSSGRESDGNVNGKKKKKRKMAEYFDRLMKEVLERQEKMQKTFAEALEKCEKDRIAREETWKAQEAAWVKREQEMLAQEKAISAVRDAALVTLLQKLSEQGVHFQLPEILLTPTSITPIPLPTPTSVPKILPTPSSNPPISVPTPIPVRSPSQKLVVKRNNNIAENLNQTSSSRWPKAETETLIRLKTELEKEYRDNGPKGPWWEEVSLSMRKFGYSRNAKKCKEKWENINKYFRRMKEGNKRPLGDSKTCSYYDLLDGIYEEKNKKFDNTDDKLKPEDILMQMQHQQWHGMQPVETEDGESKNAAENQMEDGDDESEENGNDYQGVVNNASSVTIMQ